MIHIFFILRSNVMHWVPLLVESTSGQKNLWSIEPLVKWTLLSKKPSGQKSSGQKNLWSMGLWSKKLWSKVPFGQRDSGQRIHAFPLKEQFAIKEYVAPKGHLALEYRKH